MINHVMQALHLVRILLHPEGVAMRQPQSRRGQWWIGGGGGGDVVARNETARSNVYWESDTQNRQTLYLGYSQGVVREGSPPPLWAVKGDHGGFMAPFTGLRYLHHVLRNSPWT